MCHINEANDSEFYAVDKLKLSEFPQISFCTMIRTKNGIYKPDKSRSRVEVRVNAGDSYDSTAYKACASLGMDKHDNCILLRLSGAVIPKKGIQSEDWTIGNYVESTFSGKSRPTLGVFAQYESVSESLHICNNNLVEMITTSRL